MNKIGDIIKDIIAVNGYSNGQILRPRSPLEVAYVLCCICQDDTKIIESFALTLRMGEPDEKRILAAAVCEECSDKFWVDGDIDQSTIIEMQPVG